MYPPSLFLFAVVFDVYRDSLVSSGGGGGGGGGGEVWSVGEG